MTAGPDPLAEVREVLARLVDDGPDAEGLAQGLDRLAALAAQPTSSAAAMAAFAALAVQGTGPAQSPPSPHVQSSLGVLKTLARLQLWPTVVFFLSSPHDAVAKEAIRLLDGVSPSTFAPLLTLVEAEWVRQRSGSPRQQAIADLLRRQAPATLPIVMYQSTVSSGRNAQQRRDALAHMRVVLLSEPSLGRHVVGLLLRIARNDPDLDVRVQAMELLALIVSVDRSQAPPIARLVDDILHDLELGRHLPAPLVRQAFFLATYPAVATVQRMRTLLRIGAASGGARTSNAAGCAQMLVQSALPDWDVNQQLDAILHLGLFLGTQTYANDPMLGNAHRLCLDALDAEIRELGPKAPPPDLKRLLQRLRALSRAGVRGHQRLGQAADALKKEIDKR